MMDGKKLVTYPIKDKTPNPFSLIFSFFNIQVSRKMMVELLEGT